MFRKHIAYAWAVLVLVFSIMAPASESVLAIESTANTFQGATFEVFLPLIRKSCPNTLSGRVTYDGHAEVNLPVHLRFFNGTSWSTLATTYTAVTGNSLTDGSYTFANLPNLSPSQKYYVLYLNGWPNPYVIVGNYVYFWATREITSFGETGCIEMSFDIANDYQLRPLPYQTVTLPYPFEWVLRQTTLISETYEMTLYDPTDNIPYFQTGPLSFGGGATGVYTITALPNGFATGVPYYWEVWVYNDDGGLGVSSNAPQTVTFANTGLSVNDVLPYSPDRWVNQQLIPINWYLEEIQSFERRR